MRTVQTIIASLGNAGAVDNARSCLDQRDREAWLVACLEANLGLVVAPESGNHLVEPTGVAA